ncbi:MAG: STT3 domain-containing protein [Candidatus Omnitrophica bacterium]|nr:STT3 domain-containing protein [Candidatus Omnitrophota bacterium]MDD5488751.1 STT3 domain-containing protein [Candidatus Omnitrophota bacterium]
MTTFHPKKTLYSIAIVVLISLAGVFFRMYPALVNPISKARDTARAIVMMNLHKMVSTATSQQMPGKTQEELDATINQRLRSIMNKERHNVNTSIDQAAEQFRNVYKYFLLGSDSFYYYRLTKNIADTGRLSDQIKNGKFFDPLMLAPEGHWRNIELHPYSGYFFFRAIKPFNKNMSLYSAVMYIPLILFLFSVVIFLLVCRTMTLGPLPTLISGIGFSLAPMYLQRSALGWYDSDPYNVVFPLAVILSLLLVLRKKTYLSVLCLSAVSAFYALFWQGWVFLPTIATLSLLATACYRILTGKDKAGTLMVLRNTGLFLLLTFALACLFSTPRGVISSISEISDIFSKFIFMAKNPWPDAFLTVGELKTPSLLKMIHLLGGIVFLIPFAIGAVSLILRRISLISEEEQVALLCVIILCLFMAHSAERFVLFLLPPYFICVGLGVHVLYEKLRSAGAAYFGPSWRGPVSHLPAIILIVVFFTSSGVYSCAVSSRLFPMYNVVWDEAMSDLREKTPPESIVDTWWPPGHFIRAMAERRVCFDGATLESPRGYWMASCFLANEEKEALGILRMLNSSGDNAVGLITGSGLPLYEAISLIKSLVVLDKDAARASARERLPYDKAEQLISMLFSSPPPSYCFLYNDLIDNALGLYFVKNWDFKKRMEAQDRPDIRGIKQSSSLVRGSRENIGMMWSFAGGRPYIGEETFPVGTKDGFIIYPNGVIFHPGIMEARINNLEGKISGIPESILYLDNGEFREKKLGNDTLRISVLFKKYTDGRYSCIVAPGNVLRSILYRLYYFDGAGLEHFSLFTRKEDARLSTKILVYKVDI